MPSKGRIGVLTMSESASLAATRRRGEFHCLPWVQCSRLGACRVKEMGLWRFCILPQQRCASSRCTNRFRAGELLLVPDSEEPKNWQNSFSLVEQRRCVTHLFAYFQPHDVNTARHRGPRLDSRKGNCYWCRTLKNRGTGKTASPRWGVVGHGGSRGSLVLGLGGRSTGRRPAGR